MVVESQSRDRHCSSEAQSRFHQADTQYPKLSFPDSDKFNSSVQNYNIWLPFIIAKLRTDSEIIGNKIAKFYYIYINIEIQIQANLLNKLKIVKKTKL